jgi:hypothetical protein
MITLQPRMVTRYLQRLMVTRYLQRLHNTNWTQISRSLYNLLYKLSIIKMNAF